MEKQNILSQGQDSIEPTKNLLNENQLSNQVSYPKQFQNKEDFSQNSNGFMDTNISVISEQTLQKRVRSQINRRRNVQQTRIFQNAMCQIINQSENQHAIISYEDQDNNNFIQHISSKKSSNQIVQQQNQKTFCIGNNSSQNSFVSQEGQVQQKQINKEIIPNNQIKCQQLIKLQENSLIKEQKNVQQHEKEQSLQYEKITDQVNIYQQESIHGENNCSQNNSNKKEGYINEQENIQEMSSNYQVNYLQLKNEKAYTIQQNDQQQDNNKVSLSQEYTNVQENILQLENIDRKEYMYDKNFSNNDLSKIEVYIEQKQTTKQNISNIQINSPQIIELQFEEKTNENSLKDLQKHNKENSLNQEQASNQKSAHEQKNIGENVNLIKDHVKQIYGENKTKPSSYQIQKSNLKTQNISDKDAQIQQDRNNSTQQDAPTIQNEFQSIEYKKRSKTIEQNNLTKSFSSQLDTMFKVIMDYKFSEFEKLEELQQIGCEVKKQWSQQTFEKVEGNSVQSENFKSQKSKIFECLQKKKYYLCKILISNQIQDFILGFFQDEHYNFDECIFKITYNSVQSDIEYIVKKAVSPTKIPKINKKQLAQFKTNFQQIRKFQEINSSNCQECKSYRNQEICQDKTCFKNIKPLILGFLQNKEYFYCEYSNNKVNGIIFQLNQEEFIPQYLNYVQKIIFNFQENNQIDQQNTDQQQQIYSRQNISQKIQNLSKEENVKLISNIDLVNEYQFKDYQIIEKPYQNQEKISLYYNYYRKWELETFNALNNSKVSNTFKLLQEVIIQILESKNYFLCNCFIANQQEDIFIGYQEENIQKYIDYIFVILYNPKDSELSKYNLVKQFNEEINHFIINGFTHVLILSKDVFLLIYNNYEKVINIKIEWSIDYFEKINEKKVINQKQCGDCQKCQNKQECLNKIFQESKNLIFDKLKKKNYYICEYLNKGGEGFVFQGYRQSIKDIKEKQDFVFKILFDCDQEQIQNEIQIMKVFDSHVNVIKFIDHIQIKDNIHTLVLEKCKFSLKDELDQLQQNQQFPLNKLLQMIFSLLDGLIQFRIYNILHLDIKLSNILITNQGQYVYTDFGLSQLKKSNYEVQVKGFTQYYASPEQEQYDPNIDYLSDVYSLGKTFEIILNIFQKIQKQNCQNITNELMKIVEQKMIQYQLKSRFNCLELRSEFFQFILEQSESTEFLNKYIIQIKQILNSKPYDINKDFSYFLNISLTYEQNILNCWKQFIQQNIQMDTYQIQQSIASSLCDVGIQYLNIGDNKKALDNFLESVQIRKQIFKQNHINIAQSLNYISICYGLLYNNNMALEYALNSLQLKKQIFKENHPEIAASLNNVGHLYLNLGDNKNALEYKLESLQMFQQIFKENHPDIATSLNNVGCYYKNLGEHKKALEYLLESLQMRKQIFKENHPDIADSLNNVGNCYYNLGEHKKDLEYQLESLQMRKQIFKENHPSIATSLNNVGSCYYNFGEHKKALEYQLESLQMRKQIFKENHPDIASSLNNIGSCYKNLGEHKKALEYQLESLQMRKQIFKENHPSIATSLNNVGSCYYNLGEHKKALEYLLESLQMRKQIFKENHPDIADSLNNVGNCYYNLGEHKKALEYQLESLQMRKQIFKENHPSIATSLNNVGSCYYNLGEHKKALEYLLESLQMRKQIFKENHPDIADSLNNVGNCYYKLGEHKKALEYYLESLQMRKQIFKENHPDIAASLYNVGNCYYNLGDNKKALEYQLVSLHMRIQIFKGYTNLGENKQALEHLFESLE